MSKKKMLKTKRKNAKNRSMGYHSIRSNSQWEIIGKLLVAQTGIKRFLQLYYRPLCPMLINFRVEKE